MRHAIWTTLMLACLCPASSAQAQQRAAAPATAGPAPATDAPVASPPSVGDASRSTAAPAGHALPPEQQAPQLVPPALEHFVEAVYPPEAMAAGLQAAVKLSIKVDEQGGVADVKVLEPAGHGFDEAALAAARQFRFQPATWGGQPVAVEIRFTYRFTIEQKEVRKPVEQAAQPEQPAVPTLVGRVLRRGNREPLSGLGVRVGGTDLSGETDAEGRFELAVRPGTWEIQVVHPEYEPFVTEETIRSSEVVEVVYYVEPRSRSRYRSVVRVSRPKKTVTRTTLEDVELVQVPGTFGEPFRVVQTLPGVARTPYGLGFLIVRGAAPQDTGFFIDGHEVPLLYHFLSGPAVFNADLVDSIDFYPGNFPVGFGRKQAGIVATRTKEEAPGDRLHGQASIDLLDLEALARLPLGEETELAVAGRRSHFGALIPLVTDETVRPSYWDYQVIGSTRLGDSWTGKLTLFGSYDALDAEREPETRHDPGSEAQATMGIQFHRLHGQLGHALQGGGKLELSSKLGFNRMTSRFNENLVVATVYELTLKSLLEYPLLADALTFTGGLDFESLYLDTEMDVPGMRHWTDFPAPSSRGRDEELPRTRYTFGTEGYGPAAHAALEWKLGPLLLIPGLRVDLLHYEEFTDLTFDPRLVVRCQVHDTTWLKGGVGVFHQLPDPQTLDEKYGNPDSITAPYALHYSLGAELRPLEQLDLDATFFFNDYRDQIALAAAKEAAGLVQGGTLWTNDGEGRSYGMELLVRHRPKGPFFGWIAYTLSRSERKLPGEDWQLFQFDQTHILTAVGSLELGSGWTLGVRFQLVTGNPRTPVLGGVFDADTGRYVAVTGARLSERNEAFHQLDFRVDKLFTFDTWKLTAYLDLLNAYNRENTEFVEYNYNYELRGVVPGIPILPSLGLKGEF